MGRAGAGIEGLNVRVAPAKAGAVGSLKSEP